MSQQSAIEWTDATWNPVTGCSKVSDGCDHCYAEALAVGRLKGKAGYPGLPWTPENAAENVVLRPERLDQPKRWRKPSMVFVNSMSDLFHPLIPGDFIAQVFAVMADCPQHVFQVLTKRPKRMASWVSRFQPEPLPNVWLGTSIESRDWTRRATALRATPSVVRFISAEPLLEDLAPATPSDYAEDTVRGLSLMNIDWLIVGGESGANARRIDPDWVRNLRESAMFHGTAFFFKQWGGRTAKAGGRELDGRTWDEMPFSRGGARSVEPDKQKPSA